MSRFFVESNRIGENEIVIDSGDYNHIKNVLRTRIGESVTVCDGQGMEYDCVVEEYLEDYAKLRICARHSSDTELPIRIRLFQGMPKKDKMELIVQKAIELGAFSVVPVMCERTVVKLEDKKKETKKIERLQAIAESAAKQCGRGFIPQVEAPISFKEAIVLAASQGLVILPYENALGMKETKHWISESTNYKNVSIFIGPEGGFSREEVAFAEKNGAKIISLGRRILRTETAGLCLLSMLMLETECNLDPVRKE